VGVVSSVGVEGVVLVVVSVRRETAGEGWRARRRGAEWSRIWSIVTVVVWCGRPSGQFVCRRKRSRLSRATGVSRSFLALRLTGAGPCRWSVLLLFRGPGSVTLTRHWRHKAFRSSTKAYFTVENASKISYRASKSKMKGIEGIQRGVQV
jgi:hypothetical protein